MGSRLVMAVLGRPFLDGRLDLLPLRVARAGLEGGGHEDQRGGPGGENGGKTLAEGPIAQRVCTVEGRARIPLRAAAGRLNPRVSNVCGCSRRARSARPTSQAGWPTRRKAGSLRTLSMNLEAIETAPSPFPSPPLRGRGCRRRERGWRMVSMRGARPWRPAMNVRARDLDKDVSHKAASVLSGRLM